MNGAFQTARPRCRRSSVAELSWEIQRYRVLRHKLLATYSQKAIEATLRRIGMVVIASEFEDKAVYYTLQRAELADRSNRYVRDQRASCVLWIRCDAINTEVYAQARELLVLFDGLLNAAQTKAHVAAPRDPETRKRAHASGASPCRSRSA
ncbi:hypothetical protein [Bradyrhizobium canariense]|uniref:hypothetical protein n=1 Tax=Bradyrhizobium canariense TaxID=255045 RepID=UPI001F0A28C8|nr:hypothetical protein [Bradyrhizobium canariense]